MKPIIWIAIKQTKKQSSVYARWYDYENLKDTDNGVAYKAGVLRSALMQAVTDAVTAFTVPAVVYCQEQYLADIRAVFPENLVFTVEEAGPRYIKNMQRLLNSLFISTCSNWVRETVFLGILTRIGGSNNAK